MEKNLDHDIQELLGENARRILCVRLAFSPKATSL
jgi:hypothetical protein